MKRSTFLLFGSESDQAKTVIRNGGGFFVGDKEAMHALNSDVGFYNGFVQGQAEMPGAITQGWGLEWKAIVSAGGISASQNTGIAPGSGDPVYILTSPLDIVTPVKETVL